MGRPKHTPETEGLMSWADIAEETGMTIREVQRVYERGMDKIRARLEAIGLDKKEFERYLHENDTARQVVEEQRKLLSLAFDKDEI